MAKLTKIIKLLCLLCFLGCVAGCCSSSKPTIIKNDPAVVLANKLSGFIIKMPHISKDEMVLAIPSFKLFNLNSANLTDKGKSILTNVAALLKLYEKEDVYVAGYLCLTKSEDQVFVKSLAKEQAQKVVDYLWKQRADMRMTYVGGYLLQPASVNYGSSSVLLKDNHIEIHFRVFARQ